MNRSLDSVTERIANLEDTFESIQDTIQQLGNQEIKQMQSILSTYRDAIDTYNNIFKE